MFNYNKGMFDINDINARLKKSLQGKTPKLKCLVTGLERITSMDYLKTKEEKFGSVDNYVNNYISREAIKLIKEGKSFLQIKEELNSSSNFIPNEQQINEAKKYYGI